MCGILKINGKEREFPSAMPRTAAELLERLGIEPATAAAEIDGVIVQRDDFASTAISSGQVIEIVRFVGGG